MKIRKVHCMFEQSGTFKNEFKKIGIDAVDYDIQDEFGETDNVCDLFNEIRGGYKGEKSIFDEISKDDLILCFFPCVRFEAQILLSFRGEAFQQSKWNEIQKLEYDIKLHKELAEFYEIITMMSIICYRKGLRMIFENPYSEQHYLKKYWCLKPSIVDMDRTMNGDYFVKPTQYWFMNCEPEQNLVFEPLCYVPTGRIEDISHFKIQGKSGKTSRSMIHPQYANRFIRQYIVDDEASE